MTFDYRGVHLICCFFILKKVKYKVQEWQWKSRVQSCLTQCMVLFTVGIRIIYFLCNVLDYPLRDYSIPLDLQRHFIGVEYEVALERQLSEMGKS